MVWPKAAGRTLDVSTVLPHKAQDQYLRILKMAGIPVPLLVDATMTAICHGTGNLKVVGDADAMPCRFLKPADVNFRNR